MFIAALFTIARTWKQPKCPLTDEWVKKMWHIYTMEYYSAIKKEQNWVICNEVDGPRVCHTEWSKSWLLLITTLPCLYPQTWRMRGSAWVSLCAGSSSSPSNTYPLCPDSFQRGPQCIRWRSSQNGESLHQHSLEPISAYQTNSGAPAPWALAPGAASPWSKLPVIPSAGSFGLWAETGVEAGKFKQWKIPFDMNLSLRKQSGWMICTKVPDSSWFWPRCSILEFASV